MNGRLIGFVLASVIVQPALAQQCAPGSLVATVTHVRDGDTIEVGGLPIRLQGLAAPGGNEPGGAEARVHGRFGKPGFAEAGACRHAASDSLHLQPDKSLQLNAAVVRLLPSGRTATIPSASTG